VLGIKVAASTVWEILHEAGMDPVPERSSTTWADFLRSQARTGGGRRSLLPCSAEAGAPKSVNGTSRTAYW
jgi:hypothetical protein